MSKKGRVYTDDMGELVTVNLSWTRRRPRKRGVYLYRVADMMYGFRVVHLVGNNSRDLWEMGTEDPYKVIVRWDLKAWKRRTRNWKRLKGWWLGPIPCPPRP